MPTAPRRPCRRPGCPELVDVHERPTGYCAADARHEPRRRADLHRGSASARGYDVHWQRIRAQFLKLHPLCVFCRDVGLLEPATVVDHIVALSEGGTNRHENLRPLCKRCHDARTMRDQVNGRRTT